MMVRYIEGPNAEDENEDYIQKKTTRQASKYLWLFDNGHGGMIDGVYQTRGKQSPHVPPGIYEGEFNRAIVRRLCILCDSAQIDYHNIVEEEENIPLKERVKRANFIMDYTDRDCILISVHANASGMGGSWNNARGVVVFYWKKNSERLARSLQKHLVDQTGFRNRGVKKAQFRMIKGPHMPSILSESGFFTNKEEAIKLASDEYRNRIAQAHFDFIREIELDKL